MVIFSTSVYAYSVFVLILAFGSMYAGKRIYGDNLSPLTMFALGWLLPAACAVFLPLFEKYVDWQIRGELWLAVVLAHLAFIAGHFLYVVINRSSIKSVSTNGTVFLPCKGEVCLQAQNSKILHLFFFFGMLGFALNLMHILQAGGLGLYLELGLRQVETIFGQSTLINYLYFFNALVLIIGMVHQCKFGYSRKVTAMMATSFVALFFMGLKSNIIFPALMASISFLLCRKKIDLRKTIVIGLICFISFQFVNIGRELPFLIARDASIAEILTTGLDNIFLYFTTAYVNLQEEIQNFKRYQLGTDSFQIFMEFYNFITGQRTFDNIFQYNDPIYLYNESYNTGTLLREHFRDFGYYGIVIFPFMHGIVSAFAYFCYLRRPSILNTSIYSIMSVVMLSSFFGDHSLKIQYLFWLVVLLIFYSPLVRQFMLKTSKAERSGCHVEDRLADTLGG